MKYPDNYVDLQLDDDINDIIGYKKDPTQPNWKIVLPESMVVDTVKWFHQVMGHPGEKRLQETLNQCYHHPRLGYHIDKLRLINLKGTIGCFGRSEKSNRTDRIAEKGLFA